MTITTVHNSQTCDLNAGGPCAMCSAANDYEQRRDQTALTITLNSFDDDWELAPLSRTRCVERSDAEYWYRIGGQAKERELLLLQNADMREMLRVGNERIQR